ncbi:hypothetical protein B0A70_08245 [Chryseobacterium piscicola]|uniref:Uncharacterized protein n=1 Tax=Chryseobacterium piscicola TaxID=551459 RepID=A0A2S7KF77_9FLAO|nr:hypothetical protein B0A70_08245 [Chryseobacterium piscicola]
MLALFSRVLDELNVVGEMLKQNAKKVGKWSLEDIPPLRKVSRLCARTIKHRFQVCAFYIFKHKNLKFEKNIK